MAGLPENKEYMKSESLPNIPNIGKAFSRAQKDEMMASAKEGAYAAVEGAKSGAPTGIPDLVNLTGINPTDFKYDSKVYQPGTPAGTSFFDQSEKDTFERSTPFSAEEYGYGFAFDDAPSEASVLRTTPSMGQWISDPDDPEAAFRSERPDSATWKSIRTAALDGRSSSVFEVDHVIPLWLGGTNNKENLQVLSRQDHSKKVQVEAVALTMFANGEIKKNDAMKLAMNWKDRDVTDFPTVSYDTATEAGNKGQMVLGDAQEVYAKWKYQETVAPKVSMWDDFFEKETALARGGYIDKKTEGLPAFMQGGIKGFLEAGSFGAIKYDKAANDKGGVETFGNIAGQFAGSLIPVVGMSKLYGLALGLNKGRSVLSAGLKSKGVINSVGNASSKVGSKAIDITAGAAGTAGAVKRAVTFSKAAPDPAMAAVIRAHADNFVRWTPAVVTYGQIQQSFEETPERGIRLMEDIIYGGLTGFMSPDLKGAAKAAFWTGVTTSMFDAYSENREMSWENAVVNGLLIGTLHQMSAPGVKQQALEQMNNSATSMAHDVLKNYTSKLKPIEDGVSPKYTPAELQEIQEEVQTNFMKQLGAGIDETTSPRLNDEVFAQHQQAIGSALDAIQFNSQSDETVPAYLAQRFQQWLDVANDSTKAEGAFGGAVPKNLETIISQLPADLKSTSIKYVDSEQYPSGVMRTTGLAEGYSSETAQTNEFIKAWTEGKTSPTLVAVSRPERTEFNARLSDNPSVDWMDSNPANTVQVFGRIIDESGAEKLVNLGYVPQESRIAGDKPYAFNNQKEIVDGKFSPYDPNLNKDTIAEAMEREGVDYMMLTMNKAGHTLGADGTPNFKYPWVEFSVGEQNWRRSIDHQIGGEGSIAPRMETDGGAAVLQRLNTTKNEVVVEKTKTDYIQNYDQPAYTALDGDSPLLQSVDQESLSIAKSYLQAGDEAFSQPTVDSMNQKLQETFGFSIPRGAADELFGKRDTITVNSFFTLLNKNADPTLQHVLKEVVYPPLKQLTDDSAWEMRKIFRELPISRKQAMDAPIEVADSIRAKDTVVAPVGKETVEAPVGKDTVTAPVDAVETVSAVPSQNMEKATALSKIAQQVAPETLPIKTPAQQAEITKTVARERIVTEVPQAMEILVPQSTAGLTPRQGQIAQAIDDTVANAKAALSKVKRTEYLGDEGMKRQMMGIVLNVEPVSPAVLKPGADVTQPMSNVGRPGGALTGLERDLIIASSRQRVGQEAVEAYMKATESSLGFTRGIQPKDPLYKPLEAMYRAELEAEFTLMGEKNAFIELRESMGDEQFEDIYRILNPKVQDDVLAQLGKVEEAAEEIPKFGNLGLKGGMLGDDADITNWQAGLISGQKTMRQIITDPLDSKPGTYRHVFADMLNTVLVKQLGAKWMDDEKLQGLFNSVSDSNQSNFWKNLKTRSEGDATQPIEYMRALSRGKKEEAKRVASGRKEEVQQEAIERQERLANLGEAKDGELAGGYHSVTSGAEPVGNGAFGEEAGRFGTFTDASETRIESITQRTDENVLAPSPLDSIMAGVSMSAAGGYDPTPQQAMADAIQFMFQINKARPLKLNTEIVKEVADEVLARTAASGERLSNVKDPKKKALGAYSDARATQRKADEVLKGELKDRFQALIATANPGKGKTYLEMGTGDKSNLTARIISLGGAISKRAGQSDYLQTWKGGAAGKGLTKEERLFAETFEKWQNLTAESQEETRYKDILKADAGVKAATEGDGKGYMPIDEEPPMDGKGGFFGDAWSKVKGMFDNTVEYTKPGSQPAGVANAMGGGEAPSMEAPKQDFNIPNIPQGEVPKYEFVPEQYRKTFGRAVDHTKMKPQQLASIFKLESGWNPQAQGPTEDYGLGQLTPPAIQEVTQSRGNTPSFWDQHFAGEYGEFDINNPDHQQLATAIHMNYIRSFALPEVGITNPTEEQVAIAYNMGAGGVYDYVSGNRDKVINVAGNKETIGERWNLYRDLMSRSGWDD